MLRLDVGRRCPPAREEHGMTRLMWLTYLLTFLVLTLLLLVGLPTYPTVVACDRYRPNVEVQVESTGSQGRIEQREFMGCVLYYHQHRFGVGD
jgi:hypothetical protein